MTYPETKARWFFRVTFLATHEEPRSLEIFTVLIDTRLISSEKVVEPWFYISTTGKVNLGTYIGTKYNYKEIRYKSFFQFVYSPHTTYEKTNAHIISNRWVLLAFEDKPKDLKQITSPEVAYLDIGNDKSFNSMNPSKNLGS
jgi:hypothetical protein